MAAAGGSFSSLLLLFLLLLLSISLSGGTPVRAAAGGRDPAPALTDSAPASTNLSSPRVVLAVAIGGDVREWGPAALSGRLRGPVACWPAACGR